MICVAGVASLVAALAVANAVLMSVLERTREIGIMKAVGADNRQLQFIFLASISDHDSLYIRGPPPRLL
jgi:putative ABC transport system permease protein